MVHSKLLAELTHGFGTRHEPLSQDGMASLQQIHSAVVLVAREPGAVGEGDALLTNHPGLTISVRTADCYPLLLADTRHRAVAAVHAGWRGTAARIAVEVLARMHREFGTEPADVTAAIGPGIGGCCYEVSADVAVQFGKSGRSCIDLAQANREQLLGAGVPAEQIDVVGGCTYCDAASFHSFRRDKERAGRMISFITCPPADATNT